MACSKYDYERGYEDNRFEIVVSQRFHCPICFLVLKDPVMCKNEHYYCSSCMKKHLENSLFCPTCLEPLTVDTLKPAPRIVNDYISELNIRCDFYPRGCPEMVQVENLKRHVASCGFSPVQCSNEGCDAVMNASDKHQHETEVCDFRKAKCHDCGQLKNEMREMKDEIKNEMKGMKDEIKNEMKEMKGEMKIEIKNEIEILKEGMKNEMKGIKEEMKEGMKEGMRKMVNQVLMHQDQLQDKMSNEVSKMKNEMKGMVENEMKGMKEEMKNEIKEKMKIEMKGMKEEMKGMKEEMKGMKEEMVMNAVRDAMAGMNNPEFEMKNSSQSSHATCSSSSYPGSFSDGFARSSDGRENIVLVGGFYHEGWKRVKNKSTECFNWADQTWTSLDSAVFEGRSHTCSFMYQGQMVVAGGNDDGGNKTNTMKCLNVADPAATWKDFAVNLPVKCSSHKVVSHNDQLFMSGGWVAQGEEPAKRSDAVFEVLLVPPYSSKILTRLPQSRLNHGMEMFDQKLFILGGFDGRQITASVVEYDLIKNKCKEMPPLPYAVQAMAIVLWRNNVLVIGGLEHRYQSLNKVAMYDVITGHSQMLPCMKHKRCGCSAVLTGNVVVVMGGISEKGDYLKSVECFNLERRVWQDLPDLLELRAYATAVVKPNH